MLPTAHLILSTLLIATTSWAQYIFPSITVANTSSADWYYTRLIDDFSYVTFVHDVTSPQIRCFQANFNASGATATVAAGDTLQYNTNTVVNRPGPLAFYMGIVPAGQTAATWDGTGVAWFKIYEDHPTYRGQTTPLLWPSTGKSTFPVTVPACLPAGDYLLRAEHIALHIASSGGGAEFFLSCSQLHVTGGGSTVPSGANVVEFPGAYKSNDPGIMINIYRPIPISYLNPGPNLFTC